MAKIIVLDAGHGLKTSGKQTPDGIKEWTLNDKVRDKVVKLLKDYDVKFIFPDNDEGKVDESLATRWKKYVNTGAVAMVSIHHNAFTGKWGTATGVEVYTDKNPTAKDTALAKAIYSRLVKNTGLKGRGIKQEDWYIINQDRVPAVLVEGGFMDNKNDYHIITSDAGQTAYAKAVAEGLIDFLDLKKKTTTKTTTTKTTATKTTTTKTATKTNYYPAFKSNSIVDGLKGIGANSSFANRKKIAKANGISLYVGSTSQNTKLLSLAKSGKLKKA